MSGSLEKSRRLAEQLEAVVAQLTDFTARLRGQVVTGRGEETRASDEPSK